MNNKIVDFINRINEIEKGFGDTIFYSCNESDEIHFIEWVKKLFPNSTLNISEIVFFSRVANGLNFNGLFVYSLTPDIENNIYESNSEWWNNEHQRKYLFLADDSISWYCVDTKEAAFLVLDKPSGERITQCKTFDELILLALDMAL